MTENKLEFSVDSQLLGELGERLVTRNYIALSELVKNSYDADATTITIRFINAKKGGTRNNEGEIHLSDNGHGMTFQQVKDYWMRIATPYKVREPISPHFGRRKTGNKGIGRFACQRLAKTLIFETIARIPGTKELELTKVEFNWEKFEPGTTLTEIPCEYETSKLSDGSPGLKLILKGLNERWTEADFNLLRRQLLTISVVKGTRRKGFGEDPGFDIIFDAPEFPRGEGILVDQFMDAGWGKLEGQVKENGSVSLKLNAKRIGAQHFVLPEKFSNLKHISFEIAWVPIKKEYFRDTRTLTTGIAKKIIDQFGVRVYLDGFRIYPYGSPGDDWLGIDKDIARRVGPANKIFDSLAEKLQIDRSRVLLSHPQNRHLIGRILISSEPSSAFSVKLDREGFIENEAYHRLIRCLRLSLEWFTIY
ncbi:MAG: ATP-binding protein, partial [Sedimentisphaerales bacterium]